MPDPRRSHDQDELVKRVLDRLSSSSSDASRKKRRLAPSIEGGEWLGKLLSSALVLVFALGSGLAIAAGASWLSDNLPADPGEAPVPTSQPLTEGTGLETDLGGSESAAIDPAPTTQPTLAGFADPTTTSPSGAEPTSTISPSSTTTSTTTTTTISSTTTTTITTTTTTTMPSTTTTTMPSTTTTTMPSTTTTTMPSTTTTTMPSTTTTTMPSTTTTTMPSTTTTTGAG